MKPGRMIFSTLFLLIFFTASSHAGDVGIASDGSMTWKAGIDGVEIEWNADGSVKRLYSRYSHPVEFADRRGIMTAQTIAEEKAKGAIVRFMNQSVGSNRIVTEVENDINKATQERQSGANATVRKMDERTLISNLTEVTTSFAAGKLSGVIILERGYEEKMQEAWVVVGISQKTINSARSVSQMTSGGASAPQVDQPSAKRSENDPGHQGSEIRRTNQKDW
ncbi:MAG: hypothetical protein HQL76_06365 [Magnetococcales bacterium]|nr:hypothetical protein [Magnetococcales bacterium]